MKRIAVATDGSEGAGRAIDFAAGLAKDYDADLVIANVVGGYGLPGEALRQFTHAQNVWLEELLSSASAQILAGAGDRARAQGAQKIRLESRAGEVVETLVAIAQDAGADVFVVGRRGAGRLERLLLGSVSQQLVNLAPLPVIVVP